MARSLPARRRGRGVRASDDDRESVVDLLREHCAAGRLTADELADRAGKAYAARTVGELGALLRDLPSLDEEEVPTRGEQLDRAIAEGIQQGWRLESRWKYGAVMVGGEKPDHLFHGLLTLFTGVWGFVWLWLALFGGEQRLLVDVDEDAYVTFDRIR